MFDFLPKIDVDEMLKDNSINHIAEIYYEEYEEEVDDPMTKREFAKEYIDKIILGAYMYKSHFLAGIMRELEKKNIDIELGPEKQKEESKIIVPERN